MVIGSKSFKKIGVIQILIGVGLMIYGNVTSNQYSLLYAGLGALLIFTAIIYYFGD